jgi:predicted nucleotidyltransferase
VTPRSGRPLLPHHQSTLDRAIEHFSSAPTVEAVIVGGSLAKGDERPGSDVDLIVVLDEEACRARRETKRISEVIHDLATYERGYVDIKYVDRPFLSAAAEKGSEPTRDSFKDTFVAWSRVDGIGDLISKIPVYPEALREEKIRRFYSQALLQRYFLDEARKRNDGFLMGHAKAQMILFVGRTILAHNRVLFPCTKRLLERVETCPQKPTDFSQRVDDLLNDPEGVKAGEALMASLDALHPWGMGWETALGLFTEDSEFNWRDARPPLSDW